MNEQLDSAHAALVIYDMTQTLVEEGPHYAPWVAEALPDLARLVGRCREVGALVFYANSPKGHAGFGIPHAIAPQPGDIQLLHLSPGAFAGSNLEQLLRAQGRQVLLIAGIAVDRGCNMTARQALALGFQPIMVRGACYTHDIDESPFGPISKEEIERIHLASLYRMGAGIMTVDQLLSGLS